MMVWWRFKRDVPGAWQFGFMTQVNGPGNLVRMGLWNGDVNHGSVVSRDEIETKEYRS